MTMFYIHITITGFVIDCAVWGMHVMEWGHYCGCNKKYFKKKVLVKLQKNQLKLMAIQQW